MTKKISPDSPILTAYEYGSVRAEQGLALPHGATFDSWCGYADAQDAMADAAHAREECVYCARDVAADTAVPAASDDDAWLDLAAEHGDDCIWVLTRAHRRDAGL